MTELDRSDPAVLVEGVRHAYGQRVALDGVSLSVASGEIFGLLGPNGGGKTTLFKLLSTSQTVQTGRIDVLGFSAARDAFEIRRRIGVVFQNPSLDKKLTVRENLVHHGRLYGITGQRLSVRIERSLEVVGLADRVRDRVDKLSGGLARRVEIAKSLLHEPRLLIMDEPSTGLDPAARSDLWRYLKTLPEQGVTVLTTTHLMEEADRCDRIGILHEGKLVALGRPEPMRAEIGGQVVTIESSDAETLAREIEGAFSFPVRREGRQLRFEYPGGPEVLAQILDRVTTPMESISVARPTLEDVFLKKTGHRFWMESAREVERA